MESLIHYCCSHETNLQPHYAQYAPYGVETTAETAETATSPQYDQHNARTLVVVKSVPTLLLCYPALSALSLHCLHPNSDVCIQPYGSPSSHLTRESPGSDIGSLWTHSSAHRMLQSHMFTRSTPSSHDAQLIEENQGALATARL